MQKAASPEAGLSRQSRPPGGSARQGGYSFIQKQLCKNQ
jgi:hypothetical protein